MMSSLYIGASGMRSLGEGMGVITNNLSNTNTVAFKQSMMLYQDLISNTVPCQSNYSTVLAQSGAGVAPGSIRTLFSDGSFETSTCETDMGISGIGYFAVTDGSKTLYTRAGNFRFTPEGDLVDPSGMTLMGHAIIDGAESAEATPVSLDMSRGGSASTVAAKATGTVKMISNLGGMTDNAVNEANPYAGLKSAWDGTQSPPLGSGQYSYSEAITVFDNNGNQHELNIYYDLAGTSGGVQVVEFAIGTDPADTGGSDATSGLFMTGTLSFNSAGQIIGMTAYNADGSQATLNDDGLPVLTANFADAGSQSIAMDFGISLPDGWGDAPASLDAAASSTYFYAAAEGAVRATNSTTAAGGTSVNRLQSQDGYPEGELKSLSVGKDGTLTGVYSNGESVDLYRVGLYRFTSQDGLRREGKNHFSATNESGPAEEGVAGTENYGTIHGLSLEQSNVDLAREFSSMIITQRGFQMNSKVVTTSDAMLQKALELKR